MNPTPETRTSGHRQLHFIDIDNLTGGPTRDLRSHLALRQFYDTYTNRQECDLLYVACCHFSGLTVATAWAGAKIYWRSDKNGADEALLEAFDQANFDGVKQPHVVTGFMGHGFPE